MCKLIEGEGKSVDQFLIIIPYCMAEDVAALVEATHLGSVRVGNSHESKALANML